MNSFHLLVTRVTFIATVAVTASFDASSSCSSTQFFHPSSNLCSFVYFRLLQCKLFASHAFLLALLDSICTHMCHTKSLTLEEERKTEKKHKWTWHFDFSLSLTHFSQTDCFKCNTFLGFSAHSTVNASNCPLMPAMTVLSSPVDRMRNESTRKSKER